MELARIFSMPDVKTERSIRFIIWNNEETGLQGARAYIDQRRELQGKENPPGSGKYPEPKWLGVIQHDMMLYDHGMPRADGTLPPEQRPEADVNVEFAGTSKMVSESQALAWALKNANDRYATDYPATVGNRMSNTDSVPFQDIVAGGQPARGRAAVAGRRRLGPDLAHGPRHVRELQRQGLQARPQRRADDAGRRGAAGGREDRGREEVAASAASDQFHHFSSSG